MSTKKIKSIIEIWYVFGLRKNILSIEQITNIKNFWIFRRKQCIVIFANKPYKIIKKDRWDLKNRFFKLE